MQVFEVDSGSHLYHGGEPGEHRDRAFWLSSKTIAAFYAGDEGTEETGDVRVNVYRVAEPLRLFEMTTSNLLRLQSRGFNHTLQHVTGLGLDVGQPYATRVTNRAYTKWRPAEFPQIFAHGFLTDENVANNLYRHARLATNMRPTLSHQIDGWVYPSRLHPVVSTNARSVFLTTVDPEIMLWQAFAHSKIVHVGHEVVTFDELTEV